jgi:hypothetical protein
VIALLAAALVTEWKRMGRRARLALAAVLTWVVAVNLILTFLVARPQHQARWREALRRLTTPINAPPLDPEQANRLRDDEDFGFFTYAANQIYFRPRKAELTFYPLANEVGGIEFIAGRNHLTAQKLMNAHREFQLRNEEPVRVRIKTYNYPNWVAHLDGRQIQIATEQGSGLMLIDLPAGDHILTLDFELTNPSERWARVTSALAWLLLLGWIIWDRVSQAFFRSQTSS